MTAVNGAGESVESGQVSETPVSNPAPAPPTNVDAVPGPGQASITWDSVAGATSYNLYHSTTPGVTKTTGTKIPTVTSPRVVTLAYERRPVLFRGYRRECKRRERGIPRGLRDANSQPSARCSDGCHGAPGPTQATISWIPVAGATSNLYYSTTAGVTKLTGTKIPGVTSPKVVDSLVRGVPYYFVTTAQNADGESLDSTQVTATPIAPVPQFAQTDLEGAWRRPGDPLRRQPRVVPLYRGGQQRRERHNHHSVVQRRYYDTNGVRHGPSPPGPASITRQA